METALLIDIGSTFTKVTAVDLGEEAIIATAQAPTTVETEVTHGLENALQELRRRFGGGPLPAFDYQLACSSAAGGLKMVAIGLVPDLTAEAARRAALGAGAKVLNVLSFKLTAKELSLLDEIRPDIILLAGGTDGGDYETILHNARMLSRSDLSCPIIVAGNKEAGEDAEQVFKSAGKEAHLTENVLPELDKLNVDPARSIIRHVFITNIIYAKGLDKVQAQIDKVVMPTPAAVLLAARLLSEGSGEEPGLGELMVVDPGGATTDVHSIAVGDPTKPDVALKGLPEPYVKRTVEGDLGLRFSALSLYETVGGKLVRQHTNMPEKDLLEILNSLPSSPGQLPNSEVSELVDCALAKAAIELAVERHVGHIVNYHSPFGASYVQYGKDLTKVPFVLGTGGILVYSKNPHEILAKSLFDDAKPTLLKPLQPRFLLDKSYIVAAMGLLAEVRPKTALRILKKNLTEI